MARARPLQSAMRAIVVQRQRIDDAAPGEGQARLAREVGNFLRPAQPQRMRTAGPACRRRAARGYRPGSPGHRRCGPRAWPPRPSAQARTGPREPVRTISTSAACAQEARPPSRRPAPAQRHRAGCKRAWSSGAGPAPHRCAVLSSRPSGLPSSIADGPTAHRPRQKTGSSVTAPSPVVSCQSTPSRSRT